jgi:hypothetical protein
VVPIIDIAAHTGDRAVKRCCTWTRNCAFSMTLRHAHLSPDRLCEACASLENWQPSGMTVA